MMENQLVSEAVPLVAGKIGSDYAAGSVNLSVAGFTNNARLMYVFSVNENAGNVDIKLRQTKGDGSGIKDIPGKAITQTNTTGLFVINVLDTDLDISEDYALVVAELTNSGACNVGDVVVAGALRYAKLDGIANEVIK